MWKSAKRQRVQKSMTWSEYEKTAFETSRLFIRATDIKSDKGEMYKWTFDEDFRKFWRLPKFSSKEDFEMYLHGRKKIRWDFTALYDGVPVCLLSLRENKSENILSYCTAPSFRHRGFAFEALGALIEHLGLKTASLMIENTNKKSIDLAKKLGFTPSIHLNAFTTLYKRSPLIITDVF